MENGGMVNEMLLYVSFPNKTDYEKAKDFFANESGFSAQNEIDEFKSIGFVVSSQEDADFTEIEITKELNKAGFDNYRFELEDSFEQFKNGGKMGNDMENPELFAMGGSLNSEPTEISEQTLSEIRSQLKENGLVIDNEYTNEDNDHIDYYFDVDSERFEGREPQLKALVKSIASRHELEYGFDLNRDNLFFFYKDAELFAEGGMVNEDVFASGSVKSPDGIILGKVQYNPYWKKYQVKIDGVIYGEHDYVVDAVQELRHFGFENVKIMEKGGAVEFEWNTYSYSLKPQATRENAEEKLAEFKRNNPEARNFRIEEVPYSWGIDYRIVFEHERRKMEKGGSITKTKTAADFKVGTPANYHTRNDGEQAGEIVMRDGKKTISLYPNRNYGGRDRIVINPDKINWNHMESFADAAKRAGEPFMFAEGGNVEGGKLTSQEIEKFIAAQNTWFELEDATENRIAYTTRENGNMGNDTAGSADIVEAKRLKKIIDAQFEQAETTIDTMDEWVNLTVKIKASTKNIQPQQLIQAKQYGEEAFKRGAMLTQAQDPKFMDMLKGRNPNETPSGEASTKELMNAWADGWFEAKNDAKASQMTPEPTAKEYKYAPTLRPLDIGTYPKENFVRLESDASNKFGAVAVYSAPLSLRDISHFDFFPVTELKPFVGKEMYYEYAVGEKVKVSLDGDVVILTYDDGTGEGKHRMTAVNFLQGVQDGTYRLLDDNQKSTSSICDETPAGAMQFKKVNFIDDDSDYFYYVVREEGDKYIAVSCEKIEHWLESDEIERYEYYEEVIPMSEMREVGQAMVQELKNELAKMEDKNLDSSVQKMEKEILENIDKFKASKIGEYATKAASLLGDFLESKVVNDFSLLTKYFKLELMLPKTYRLGLSQFYDESYRTVENWAKNLNTNIWGLFPEEITQMPNIKQIEVKPDPEDKGLAQLLSPFVSKDELRTAMLGVYFDEYGITATDAHVMLHLNLKSENRGIYCITDDCLKKVEGRELKGNQIDRRYPDYQAIVPMRNAISKTVKLDEILTFLSAMDKAQAYRNEKVKIVAFSADNMIFAYSNILSTKIFTAFKKLGYEEVEMLLDDSERRDSRACVIIPKGNKDRLSYDTDFGLLMPVIWDENYKYPVVSNLEKGILYFDLDTHSVITHGAGEPISLIESTNNKKSVKTNANSNKAKVEATTSTTMSQSDFEFFKGLDYLYKNPFLLNRAIEELIKYKGMSSVASDYSTEEKMFLKKYSGMGGLEKFGAEGIGLLYEYFTPDEVVKKMWGLAYKHGYNNGRVLEPSCGIGSFLEYAPDKSNPVGYEINPYSAIIAKVLYPKTTIIEQPFETIFIKDNSSIKAKTAKLDKYDLIIGNPPYGNFNSKFAGMGEKQYTKAKNYVEYFMLRGLDLLNTDGLLIMIIGVEVAAGGTPFLQQGMTPTKEMIAERGDLVEAYRLPNGVFDRTDVLTDIVVIKKK